MSEIDTSKPQGGESKSASLKNFEAAKATTKATPKATTKAKSKISDIDTSWVSMSSWLTIFKVFIMLGVVIFTIGQFAGVADTDLAAYIWFAIGVIATWVITVRIIARSKNEEVGILSILSNFSQILPTLGIMVPLAILIYVLIKTKPILNTSKDNLPPQFYWFNRLSFFLIVFQLFILSNYYETSANTDSKFRNVWIAGMILFSVLTSASAIELYVIITSFITGG